jgi:hypothetical protein
MSSTAPAPNCSTSDPRPPDDERDARQLDDVGDLVLVYDLRDGLVRRAVAGDWRAA